ncbi:MAG TPA: PH domain-containing protein [Candidatus Saccharimonadales bacterium]
MANKTFEGQHDDEDVVLVFRQFPIVMRKGLLLLLAFWVIGLLPYSYWFDQVWALYVLIGGLVLGLLALFYAWVGWYFTLHIVTNQRFIQISQEGLFKRTVVDIGLDKIQNINYQIAGLQETMLGFGTIIVQTFVGDLVLKYIHHPARVQTSLIKTIKDNGFEYRGEEGQATP